MTAFDHHQAIYGGDLSQEQRDDIQRAVSEAYGYATGWLDASGPWTDFVGEPALSFSLEHGYQVASTMRGESTFPILSLRDAWKLFRGL